MKALMRRIKATDYNTLVDTTRIYWHNYLKSCRTVISGNENADSVYRRSLLLFKLMINNSTGGILASRKLTKASPNADGMHIVGEGMQPLLHRPLMKWAFSRIQPGFMNGPPGFRTQRAFGISAII